MTDKQRHDNDALSAIGWELFDRRQAGTLDFEAFQTLFYRALAICGPGDEMEMFCHYARGDGWFAWMTREIQQASSKHVA